MMFPQSLFILLGIRKSAAVGAPTGRTLWAVTGLYGFLNFLCLSRQEDSTKFRHHTSFSDHNSLRTSTGETKETR